MDQHPTTDRRDQDQDSPHHMLCYFGPCQGDLGADLSDAWSVRVLEVDLEFPLTFVDLSADHLAGIAADKARGPETGHLDVRLPASLLARHILALDPPISFIGRTEHVCHRVILKAYLAAQYEPGMEKGKSRPV